LLASVVALFALAGAVRAQEAGVLDSLFGDVGRTRDHDRRLAQASMSDLVVRIEQLEAQIRQLTGALEQLQFRNQQLEAQLRRLQDAAPPLPQAHAPAGGPPAAGPVRRSDVFDPAQHPTAPGAPRTLGTLPAAPPSAFPSQDVSEAPPIGAPGGREAGAPLDLTTLGSQVANPSSEVLPPPPPRNLSSTGAQAAVLPPSATAKDQYDLGYGAILRKDYALAEEAFQIFLQRYPKDKLASEAQFWLGESLFQRQDYRAAAEAFLAVSTKHASSSKAPEAMLRLGQSLAALGQREMACATFAEIGRKYPRASASVRQGAAREQKRVC